MKLILENLGRIPRAEIEIRPLTVFIGPNNTNKTWAAHALFGLLEGSRWTDQRTPDDLRRDSAIDDAAAALVGSIMARVRGAPLNTKLVERLERSDALLGLTAPVRSELRGRALEAVVGAPLPNAARATLEFPANEFGGDIFGRLELTIDGSSLLLNFVDDGEGYVDEVGKLHAWISRFLHAEYRNVRCLPAERALAAMLAPALQDPKLGLARPLADFVFMRGAAQARGAATPETLIGRDAIARLEQLVGGRYARGDGKALSFVPATGGSAIPLRASASMVNSLAGLWAYLQNEAGNGDVLIIDEPEMNAHPRAQAETVELLAMLANRGITIVVTTHSPYLVDHLTSLMEGASDKLDDAKRAKLAQKLYLQDPSAFISAEKLAVYGFEANDDGGEVTVRPLLEEEERHIDWSTFSKVSDELSNTYADVLDEESGAS